MPNILPYCVTCTQDKGATRWLTPGHEERHANYHGSKTTKSHIRYARFSESSPPMMTQVENYGRKYYERTGKQLQTYEAVDGLSKKLKRRLKKTSQQSGSSSVRHTIHKK